MNNEDKKNLENQMEEMNRQRIVHEPIAVEPMEVHRKKPNVTVRV